MVKYLDMPGLTYFYNQIKNRFADKTQTNSAINNEKTERVQSDNNILNEIRSMKNAFGKVFTARTASAMTDIGKIYVYIGSESGYTNGNWYYYNDNSGSWESGGVYNSTAFETDKELSVSDMAADAKSTGDAIANLKSALDNDVVSFRASLSRVDAKYNHIYEVITPGSYLVKGNQDFDDYPTTALATEDLFLLVCKYSNDWLTQICIPFSGGDIYFRNNDTTGSHAGSWKPLISSDDIPKYRGYIQKSAYELLANVVTPGFYYCTEIKNYSDAPFNSNYDRGFLIVIRTSGGWVNQLLFQDFSDNSGQMLSSLYYRGVNRTDASQTTPWGIVGGDHNSWLTGKKVSIIGDSIDTFDKTGYKIDGYNMYYPHGDVTGVDQTWWMRVINKTHALLEINASWSGSRVTNTASDSTYPDFYDRVNVVGNPDVVFVTLGTNDSFGNVPLGNYEYDKDVSQLSESEFRPAYIKGIKALKESHPIAEIVCIAEKMDVAYKESVLAIANHYDAKFIDVSDYIGESPDNALHPGVDGMNQIADWILHPIDKTISQNEFPADAKALNDSLFTKNEKNVLLDVLKNTAYLKTNEAYYKLYDLFDNSVSYSLKDSDFESKVGINVGSNASYPYTYSINNRKSYCKTDLRLEFGKTYKIKVFVTPKYMSTANMIVYLYDKEYVNATNNKETLANAGIQFGVSTWSGLTREVYAGYTQSYNKVVGAFISVRENGNNEIHDDFEILKVVVEEVSATPESSDIIVLKDDDFIIRHQLTYSNSAPYPFFYKNDKRKAYVDYDLIFEQGHTYNITAKLPDKYAPNAHMAIEGFDDTLLNAYLNKTQETFNTTEHTSSIGFSSLSQKFYMGKTRGGLYDLVGFRLTFELVDSDGNLVNIPDDYIIEQVIIEDVTEKDEIFSCSGYKSSDMPHFSNELREIIVDTDWMEDVDDVLAIRVLAWGVQTRKINLIGAVLDAIDETSVSSLSKMLDYEGLGYVEIGADKQAVRQNRYPEKDYHNTIIDNWSYGKYSTANDVEDCVTFYRRKLVQASGKVDIVSLGFLNALSKLLDSEADAFSNMIGRELVEQKVGTIWVMGGRYPTDSSREFNFGHDELARQSVHNFCEKCPVPVVYLGYEVGDSVLSGSTIDENDLIYKCLSAYGVEQTGRKSWDPMTALLAVRGGAIRSGYGEVRGTNSVNSSTGVNTFTNSASGKDVYVVKHHTDDWYESELNRILEKHGW